jgi:hypothetical protein
MGLRLGFGRSVFGRLGFFFRRAAIEADKHRRAEDAFERAVVTRLVDTALDAAHGVAGAAKSFKRRAAFFGFVTQAIVGDFGFFWA